MHRPETIEQGSAVRPLPVVNNRQHSTTASEGEVLSTVDAENVFWHCKLNETSSKLMTFESPFGKYRYLHLPYGFSSAPEIFHRKILEVLAELEGIACIENNILVYGCGATINEA